jgi:general secretion pathway protein B
MSSILKALRKVGEEKRVDQHAAPDLRLDQGLTPVESKPFLPLLTGIALGAVIVGLFFLWVQKDAEPVAKVAPLTATAQVVSVEKKTVDLAAPAKLLSKDKASDQSFKDLSESIKVPVVVVSPESGKAIENIKVESFPKSPATKPQPPYVASLASKPATIKQAPSIVVATKAPVVEATELPEGVALLVTEIFHQDDSANSMAVVNDLPVMVGTYVDSAVVAEIRLDSVLFNVDGKSFAVAVSKP